MKRLQVADQVRLSPWRCLALTLSGIRFRLFRSMVTVVILGLAVTFLTYTLAYTLIEYETRRAAALELDRLRELGEWVGRLSSPDPTATIRKRLAGGAEPYVGEYQRWAGADEQAMAQVLDDARALARIEAYFDTLPDAARVIILGGRPLIESLAQLREDAGVQRMRARFGELGLPPPPGGIEGLAAFARESLGRLERFTESAFDGQRRANEQVQQAIGERSVQGWLADLDDPDPAILVEAGYTATSPLMHRLRRAARQTEAFNAALEAVGDDRIAQEMMRRLDVPRRHLQPPFIARWLDSPDRAQWLAALVNEYRADALRRPLEPDLLLEGARRVRQTQRLSDIVGPEPPEPRAGLFDLPERAQWLMLLSLMVCAVGVTNAMFMSVTERFAEIATMKCLGALNGTLMQMFLFESVLQGLAGSLAGIVLGLGIAMLRAGGSFGLLIFEQMPVMDLAICAVLALGAGLVMAVAAAVGPTWAVARLAPMEAMRIE